MSVLPKYLLTVAIVFGTSALRQAEPAVARPASGDLKFRVLPGPRGTRGLAFSRDGKELLCWTFVDAANSSRIAVRNVRVGKVLSSWPYGGSASPAAAMDNTTVWTGTNGLATGKVEAWSRRSRKRRVLIQGYWTRAANGNQFAHGLKPVGSIAVSPDGSQLIVGANADGEMSAWGRAVLVDARTGRITKRLWGANLGVGAVAFSPDGRAVAYGDGNYIRVSSARTGVLLRKLRSGSKAQAIAFRGRDELVSLNEDGALRFWNTRNGQLKRILIEKTFPRRGYGEFVLSPNGHALALSSDSAPIRLYAVP
jgi:WD40 repeat protein